MSGIDPLSALAGASGADGAQQPAQLGQNEFLKLMLAQLRNQDPFKPTDPAEFLGQLAQFSSVTGIQNMESSLTELANSLRSSQALSGATLVGREVLSPSSSATLTAGASVHGAVQVPDGAAAVQLVVRDSAGQNLATPLMTRPCVLL